MKFDDLQIEYYAVKKSFANGKDFYDLFVEVTQNEHTHIIFNSLDEFKKYNCLGGKTGILTYPTLVHSLDENSLGKFKFKIGSNLESIEECEHYKDFYTKRFKSNFVESEETIKL